MMTRRTFGVSIAAAVGVEGRFSKGSEARDFFYRPDKGWAGDFIPFYKNGRFHLFYLLDWRDRTGHGEGVPWYQVSTTDFVNFTEHGEMLARGAQDEQDLYVFTGSVVEGEGKYHIFYTGHNPYMRRVGKPEQGIMHAESTDLLHWEKIPHDTFFAPADRFEPNDWRDPFVFRNEEAGEYWMLNAARLKTGPSRRRGCTSLCSSKDLRKWQVRQPLCSPGLYFTHECPDLFRMGDWWYLIFSEFTERSVTRYRMSRSLAGPWLVPDVDTFDGHAFYAAKTASDGKQRFLFGWNPTRDGAKDYAKWNWGGNLVVHQVMQNADGTLSVRVPDTVKAAFGKRAEQQFRPGLGDVQVGQKGVSLSALRSFSCVAAGPMQERCRIDAEIRFDPATRGCGLMLHASDDYESAYYIRLNPARNRLVFDMWPRDGDVPYMLELERHIDLRPENSLRLTVLADGPVCVVYANEQVAMNARMYNLKKGNWGVFVQEGKAYFTGLNSFVQE